MPVHLLKDHSDTESDGENQVSMMEEMITPSIICESKQVNIMEDGRSTNIVQAVMQGIVNNVSLCRLVLKYPEI